MRATSSHVLFTETQRFTQPWIWALVIGISAMVTFGMLTTDAFPPAEEGASQIPNMVIMAVSVLAAPVVLLLFRLDVRVTSDALDLRFFPIWGRRIEYADIARVYARTYRPLLEYGGWGIRYSFRNGKAYNVKGNEGLQLELKNGGKILIGSQRAAEMELAVKRGMRIG